MLAEELLDEFQPLALQFVVASMSSLPSEISCYSKCLARQSLLLFLSIEPQGTTRLAQALAQRPNEKSWQLDIFVDRRCAKAVQDVSPKTVHQNREGIRQRLEQFQDTDQISALIRNLTFVEARARNWSISPGTIETRPFAFIADGQPKSSDIVGSHNNGSSDVNIQGHAERTGTHGPDELLI